MASRRFYGTMVVSGWSPLLHCICKRKRAALLACQILEAPEYMTGQIITMDGGWI